MNVRPGIYLEDHPPARSQYRVGRRDPAKSVIVVHTAESGTDFLGPDPKAENVASFIQSRSNPGSYHLVGDTDSIVQLVDFGNEAYHDGTGSNRWAVGISLAMNSADWPRMGVERRALFVASAAQMAVMAARWMRQQGLSAPAPVLLTKSGSDKRGASGFISHARRDPGRRTDPGDGFPWGPFFEAYTAAMDTPPAPDPLVVALQEALNKRGADLVTDGIYGPLTNGAVGGHIHRSDVLADIQALLVAIASN